jgi:hypothetical protein
VVLIHRFVVLGVDLHCHKISSPNSSYFSRNQRFSLPIFAQIDEQLAQKFSQKSANRLKPDLRPAKAETPGKAGPSPAKAGLPAGQLRLAPSLSLDRSAPLLAARPQHQLDFHRSRAHAASSIPLDPSPDSSSRTHLLAPPASTAPPPASPARPAKPRACALPTSSLPRRQHTATAC